MIADTTRPPYRANGSEPPPVKLPDLPAPELFAWVKSELPGWTYEEVRGFLRGLAATAVTDASRERAIATLTLLMDRRYPTGQLRRSCLLSLIDVCFARIIAGMAQTASRDYVFVSADHPFTGEAEVCQTAVIDARGFPPEGADSAARQLVRLYRQGFRKFILAHARGHRFIGNGFGPGIEEARIDVYGSSGDYLASGMDGLEIVVHGNAQDQLAQIMKSGKLVVYGDVGQTFGYAAKGGEAYVLGNAAGRPLINAVGKPRVVINGTCLDYLAESFMAGDPHNGGGFVILNGITLTDDGAMVELDTPYPGGNLFSLASGGAIYVRDPHGLVTEDQLNGGQFFPFSPEDWELIRPYLAENGRLFDIPVDQLLQVDGRPRPPEAVYRKIGPAAVRALQAEEVWVGKK